MPHIIMPPLRTIILGKTLSGKNHLSDQLVRRGGGGGSVIVIANDASAVGVLEMLEPKPRTDTVIVMKRGLSTGDAFYYLHSIISSYPRVNNNKVGIMEKLLSIGGGGGGGYGYVMIDCATGRFTEAKG